jgi:signal transduction histidine kinase
LTEGQASLDEEIELVATTRAIVSRHFPLAVKCQRDLAFEAETSAVVTHGNHRAIECVIANLIDNALRAEPKHGVVLIRVTAAGIVEVSDHGCGVALSDRDLIFEPFWRKDVVSPGLGLGLAIAKELVEKSRGRIWIEETPGGGSTFKVRLPFSSEAS